MFVINHAGIRFPIMRYRIIGSLLYFFKLFSTKIRCRLYSGIASPLRQHLILLLFNGNFLS